MAQFTKKAIVESFLKLLNQKPLDKITVREIVEDCEINRNTFYYHFEDIHALLTFIVDTEVERVLADCTDIQSLEDGFIEAADFALKNKRAVFHIYNSVSRKEAERYLYSVAEAVVRRLVEKEQPSDGILESDRELLIHFYKCGLVGIVTGWLEEGMKTDPENMIRSLGRLLDGSITLALSRDQKI